MKILNKILVTVLSCVMGATVCSGGGVASAEEDEGLFDIGAAFTIEKSNTSDFKILQFTDTHVPNKAEGETKVFKYTRKWVDEVNPDLIVITGDGVNGSKDGNDIKAVIEEMNSYSRPWAYIFGNHEKDNGLGIKGISAILQAEARREGTYLLYDENYMKGNGSEQDDRYGNYVINIMQRNSLIYSLFMFDCSREYRTFLPEQTQWYKEGVMELSEIYCKGYSPFEGKVIPSMVFHHVPTDEYQYAANAVLTGEFSESDNGTTHVYELVKTGVVPAKYGSGANFEFSYGMRDGVFKNKRIHNTDWDKELKEYAMYEDPRSEAGFFSVAKDLHSTTHMFCGHRHTNDATITYEGITLTFGTKTGYCNSANGKQHGCTAITIENKTNNVTVEHLYDEKGY